MFVNMKLIWHCMFSPRLYKIYKEGTQESLYLPYDLEKWGDKIIKIANTIFGISIYASPFICLCLYKKGYFCLEDSRNLLKLCSGIFCIIAFSILMRSCGRASNPKYVQFLNAISHPVNNNKELLSRIRNYDFEFDAWPVTYTMPANKRSPWIQHPFAKCANTHLPFYQRSIIQILSFFATHTFALRLIYPGSLGIVHNFLWPALLQGRTQLVEQYNGERVKLCTADGNFIDAMFIDKRISAKGKTLVICCEGNSGFYEIGIMISPVKAGYSVIGWNHPGFAGSTGLPYPDQEHNAIHAVVQYAIDELGFEPKDVVLFGWSIGGYVATWAAVNYPEIKALVLDATFDDLLPLAENQMPSSWSLLVKEVIRSYVNLNIADLMMHYSGPVVLIRRTEDEIICLRPGEIATNRCNHLLMRILEERYPNLTREDSELLLKYISLSEIQRTSVNRTEFNGNSKILSLVSKYMRDYKATHCVPLPEDNFDQILNHLNSTSKDF